MTSSARKAWNEAMKATAGIAALPPAIQEQVIIGSPQQQKRRSDRHRGKSGSRRATKAAKVFERENDEYRTWVWLDALEGVDPSINGTPDDDDDFGDIAESPDHDDNKKRTRKSKTTSSRSKQQKSESLPKYLMPRSLGTILMDELNSRTDGTTYAYLGAEAHISRPSDRLVKRKFCPVTGLFAKYTHPKTGIPYSSLTALDQILERPPPWMTLATNNNNGSSAATYLEALKSITQQE